MTQHQFHHYAMSQKFLYVRVRQSFPLYIYQYLPIYVALYLPISIPI